jgi:hypothetical protein
MVGLRPRNHVCVRCMSIVYVCYNIFLHVFWVPIFGMFFCLSYLICVDTIDSHVWCALERAVGLVFMLMLLIHPAPPHYIEFLCHSRECP